MDWGTFNSFKLNEDDAGRTEDRHDKPKQKAHIHVPGFGKASALNKYRARFKVYNMK